MAGGERHDAWADCELQLLYDHVHDSLYMFALAARLPHRTPGAIQQRMSALRREAAIQVRQPGAKAKSRHATEREKAKAASDKYTAALLEMVS